MWETEVENEKDKFLSVMKNIPDSGDVNAEDITEWIANDEVNELTGNDIVEMVKTGEVREEKEEEDGRKKLIPHSEGFKTIEAALQYISQQD